METALINGLFLILGSAITGCITLLNGHLEKKKRSDRKQFLHLCDQIISYYKIEELYIQEISRLRSSSNEKCSLPKAIKYNFQEQIRDTGFSSITVTARDAENIKKNIEQ